MCQGRQLDTVIQILMSYFYSTLMYNTVRALATYGAEKLTEEQAADLVSQLEADNAGLIHYLEYVNMMMSS